MMEHMFQVLWNNYVVNIYYLFFLAPFFRSCCSFVTRDEEEGKKIKIPLKNCTESEKKFFFMACFGNPLYNFATAFLFSWNFYRKKNCCFCNRWKFMNSSHGYQLYYTSLFLFFSVPFARELFMLNLIFYCHEFTIKCSTTQNHRTFSFSLHLHSSFGPFIII